MKHTIQPPHSDNVMLRLYFLYSIQLAKGGNHCAEFDSRDPMQICRSLESLSISANVSKVVQ